MSTTLLRFKFTLLKLIVLNLAHNLYFTDFIRPALAHASHMLIVVCTSLHIRIRLIASNKTMRYQMLTSQ